MHVQRATAPRDVTNGSRLRRLRAKSSIASQDCAARMINVGNIVSIDTYIAVMRAPHDPLTMREGIPRSGA